MQHRFLTYIVALTAFICGIYIAISLMSVMAGMENIPVFLSAPGGFFFRSYSYLSFYIPAYLLTVTVLLLRRRLHKPLLFGMTAAVFPLLTFALIFQLLTGSMGNAAAMVSHAFGPRTGASLLLLLGITEILAIYILILHFFYGLKIFVQPGPKLLEAPKQDPQTMENSGEPEGLHSPDISGDSIEENGEREWGNFPSPDEGISFPDIPGLPPLKAHRELRETNERPETEEAETSSPAGEGAAETEIAGPVTARESFPQDSLPEESLPKTVKAKVLFDEGAGVNKRNSAAGDITGDIAGDISSDSTGEDGALDGMDDIERDGVNGGTVRKAKRFTYANYKVPEDELLREYPDQHYWVIDDETRQWAEVLKNTLEEFKISAEVTGIQKGPVITMFEILPAPGVKLSKIVNLADNIALRLAARRVRIVAPIPGKHAVGIEVPNKKRSLVSFKEMLQSEVFQEAQGEIPIILGKDITGETQILNLTQTPHLLIAGATGSGKSVCVNSIICSILYTRSPNEVRMVLIDPKIVELKLYNDIPHLLTPVITEPKRAFQMLQYLLYEMERRYSLLDSLGVRDVQSFNKKIKRKKLATEPLPYIVVIIDEFADLMATSGKELESTLARLAAMSRAVGIHLVLATQRPSIDVITGLIKANIPSRIAFMVAGKFDSRIIIDTVGAEKLLGQGDMLLTTAWNPHPARIQGAFLSEEEVEQIADYIRTLGDPDYIDEEIFFDDDEDEWNLEMSASGDPLMTKAIDVVVSAGKASASYLQRRLKIGYNRAARIVEEMEERGIVGPQNGSKPREILHVPDEYRQ